MGNSLVVQWLGSGVLTARDLGLIPGQGTNIPCRQNKQTKKSKDGQVRMGARFFGGGKVGYYL